MQTTIGSLLLNQILPQDMRDYQKSYSKKDMMELLSDIGKKYPDKYAPLVKSIKDFGDNAAYEETSSFDYHDIKPVDTSKIFKKYIPEYKVAYNIKDHKRREKELFSINQKYENDINSLVSKDLSDSPTRFSKWVSTGARGSNADIRQMLYSVGNMVDVDNTVSPHVVTGNLSRGLKPSEYLTLARGARKGITTAFLSVQQPGALSKELFTVTNDLVITEDDCGTSLGKSYPPSDKYVLDRYLATSILEFPRNTLILPSVRDSLLAKKIPSITVRTPIYCQSREGVCAHCFGILADGSHPTLGDNVGVRSSQAITEKTTQMALEAKHSGGVIGKKTPFDIMKQVLHVPENFPGGSVLSQVSGKIKSIEKLPDGGRYIHVDEHPHYVQPSHDILVKPGDVVDKGHIMTTGILNPAELLKLNKDMLKGRESLSHLMHSTYADAGIKSHPKAFETLSRAILNLAKVTDPGDHDYSPGEIVKYNAILPYTVHQVVHLPVVEAVGYRLSRDYLPYHKDTVVEETMLSALKRYNTLEVYKSPMKIEPFMIGSERAALHKGDWLSNLGYRYLTRQLIDNLSVGAVANIHSNNPISAYAYGAEFGLNNDKGTY